MRVGTGTGVALLIGGAGVIGLAALTGCPTGVPGAGGPISYNLPPTAIIVADVTRGIAPLTVQFDSDRSTDDGLIVARQWDFGDGGTSQDISPRYTFATNGEFTVSLTLTDDRGASSTATTVIRVTSAPVPIIVTDRTSLESAPGTIQFDGSSSFDPDGEIVSFEWDFGDNTSELIATVAHQYVTAGVFRATLRVTDNIGVPAETSVLIQVGIPVPEIAVLNPPAHVQVIAMPKTAPLWLQGEVDVDPSADYTIRAGIDGDTDACDAQCVVVDIASGAVLTRLTQGFAALITDAGFDLNETGILSGSEDGVVRIHSISSGNVVNAFTQAAAVSAAKLAPNREQFAYGLTNGEVHLQDIPTGIIVRSFVAHTGRINDIVFSNDGTRMATASDDRSALVWDIDTATVLRNFTEDLPINAVAFSPPDRDIIATGGDGGTVRIWEVESGALAATLAGHTAAVNDLVFSDDGTRLFSASSDNTARAWDTLAEAEAVKFTGNTAAVTALTYAESAGQLVTGAADGAIRVWTAASGAAVRTIQPCGSAVGRLEIAADGRRVVASIGAKNGLQLDTTPSSGNDLVLTFPQPLSLTGVPALDFQDAPSGEYFVWAQVNTNLSDPVRGYSSTRVRVFDPFPDTIEPNTPVVLPPEDEVTIVPDPSLSRQIVDLGPMEPGDRITMSLAEIPAFTDTLATAQDDNGFVDYTLTLLDNAGDIFAMYQDELVHITRDTQLVVARSSPHFYLAIDGAIGVNLRIERQTDTFPRPEQVVLVNFSGAAAVGVGPAPSESVPVLVPSDFDDCLSLPGGWDETNLETLKQNVLNELEQVYNGYNVRFVRSDTEAAPAPPFLTLHVSDRGRGVLGLADYVDPRNNTRTGTAVVYALDICETAAGGNVQLPLQQGVESEAARLGAIIGRIGAHEVGKMLGLRVVAGGGADTDIMENGLDATREFFFGDGDPTIERALKRSRPWSAEQFEGLSAAGFQNAPQQLVDTIGAAP